MGILQSMQNKALTTKNEKPSVDAPTTAAEDPTAPAPGRKFNENSEHPKSEGDEWQDVNSADEERDYGITVWVDEQLQSIVQSFTSPCTLNLPSSNEI